MLESGVRRDRWRDRIDAIAAAVVLQGYLDSLRYRRPPGEIRVDS